MNGDAKEGVSRDVPPSDAAVLPAFVSAATAKFDSNPKLKLAQNTVCRLDVRDVLMKRTVTATYNHNYSVKVPQEGKVTDQKQTGRCWLFAALNIMRLGVMKKYSLPDDFELSQSHLFFWDKLEKANYFLENVLLTLKEPLECRLMQHLLKEPLCDGGQWDMLANLVRKYGVVPKSVYGESVTSSKSYAVNRFLTIKLREYTLRLRSTAEEHGAASPEVKAAKEAMLEEVHTAMLVHFGPVPGPEDMFEWVFTDKDKGFHRITGLTPLSFVEEHVELKVEEVASLIHDPRNPYYASYSVSYLGNVVGGAPIRYINVPVEELKRYAMEQLDKGEPVWMGVDVFKEFHGDLGVLDTNLYDYGLVYGTELGMTKKERLLTGESLMSHAMVFTGYDKREGEEFPNKWRVENSWGDSRGDKGYFMMTDDWFSAYAFQIVVNKKDLEDKLKPLLTDEPILLPAWDPMGSLAAVRDPSSAASTMDLESGGMSAPLGHRSRM